jgi:exopolyphosphatase/guanosine-5'-triphosphate,3'-diphosphate pyrophosphatase
VKNKTYTTFAAVHLGSEAISMIIVEYRSLNNYKIVEQCQHPVHLGEETFKNKLIPFSLVNEICAVLQGYKELMYSYGVEEYVIKATTAVREARNRLFLLDQIQIKTGLKVDVIDMPQEIYTKYVAIRNTLQEQVPTAAQEGMLLLDISSGGLGITFVQDEKIKYQANFHMGIIRIKESFNREQRSSTQFNKALIEFLSSTIGPVRQALAHQKVRYLVLSGTETEMILKMQGRTETNEVERVKAQEFKQFFKKVRHLNLSQIIQVYHLKETEAALVLPTILLYEQLLDLAPAQEVLIPKERFIDGVMLLQIGQKNSKFSAALDTELINYLHHLGEIYQYDARHAAQVEWLACVIFDKLGAEHGLDAHCRLLLRAAAILHDIGKYVSMRSHSLYSYELLMATDMIGFDERDKKIIAMAAYYHAHNVFEENKQEIVQPEPELLPIIAKVSAIIRLADAMDRSYKQKIKSCRVVVKQDEIVIKVTSKEDLTLEEWTFASKAAMFEEVYGLKIRLERVAE